jgi:uncharacterized protein with HEPN domain
LLEDIEEACGLIARWVGGMTREQFEDHDLHYNACLRQLMVIGEAVKGLPQDVRDLASEVRWSNIAGLRDVLAHGYFSLNDATLWLTCIERVPELHLAVVELLARDSGTGSTG